MENLQELAANLGISKTYLSQGSDSLRARNNLMKTLISERRMPREPWNDQTIEYLLQQLSIMDSNNFLNNSGLGEREGRVFSPLVHRRHFGLSHGIGRSGDISEVQPKAVGSSVLYKLVNHMLLHALHISGMAAMQRCLMVPLATGMTLALCMQTLKKPEHKYVIWSRIDQKSCFKSISAAGLIPLVVETVLIGDALETDIAGIRSLLQQYGAEVACVLSTTSCFTPRCPDKVDEIATLCQEFEVSHVINNAYGMQCARITRLITRAVSIGGRVDFVVQSCDKNLLVPVGGAVIASPVQERISQVAKLYPGRASSAPILDVFITLLSMGESGYRHLLEERNRLFPILVDGLNEVAKEFGERVLMVPNNSISFGITLNTVKNSSVDPTFFGSLLFQRSVSGARVINPANAGATINGIKFPNFGAHYNGYPEHYMTAACAIGLNEPEIALFLLRLRKCFLEIQKKYTTPTAVAISADTATADVSATAASASDSPAPRALSSTWIEAYTPKQRPKKVKKAGVQTDKIVEEKK
jgi:O-phospho-L-seryl-tRNASec:L-selenocysteinyl-tRNA synthase